MGSADPANGDEDEYDCYERDDIVEELNELIAALESL
jgi:hypothetical protein